MQIHSTGVQYGADNNAALGAANGAKKASRESARGEKRGVAIGKRSEKEQFCRKIQFTF
jgi:hypothetical protein